MKCEASTFCTKAATRDIVGSGWSFYACEGHAELALMRHPDAVDYLMVD